MAYFEIEDNRYTVEYSIYDSQLVFVHRIDVNLNFRGRGLSYAIFKSIKQLKLPIVLECNPWLEEFYIKHGFYRSANTRGGFLEMTWKENNA